MARISTIFDYIFNSKEIIVTTQGSRNLEQDIKLLIEEKRALESNLFFLDLLKNLAAMLYFAVGNAGYQHEAACEILSQAMGYLQTYARGLSDAPSASNQQERVSLAAARLERVSDEALAFLRNQKGETAVFAVQASLQMGTEAFDSFMKQEYASTKFQIAQTNQLLVDRCIELIEAT